LVCRIIGREEKTQPLCKRLRDVLAIFGCKIIIPSCQTQVNASNHPKNQEDVLMKKLLCCAFNMDTACVELRFSDGSLCSIDTIAVENEIARNMYE
jgi:hypothetical protein